MKKILSLTGIIALVAIVTFDAYAASPGTDNPTNHATQQGFMTASLRTDHTAINAMEDDSYSEYGYHSGGNRGGHSGGGNRGGHQGSGHSGGGNRGGHY